MAHDGPKSWRVLAKKLEGSTRLFVRNVSHELEHSIIQEAFHTHGNVVFAYNTRKGYAFVHCPSLVEAQHVMNAANGTNLGGRTLEVTIAKVQGRNSPGYIFSQLEGVCFNFTIGECKDNSCTKGAHICGWCLEVAGQIENHSANSSECPQQTAGYIPDLSRKSALGEKNEVLSARGDHVAMEGDVPPLKQTNKQTVGEMRISESEDEVLSARGDHVVVTETIMRINESEDESLQDVPHVQKREGVATSEDDTEHESSQAQEVVTRAEVIKLIKRLDGKANALATWASENYFPEVTNDMKSVRGPGMEHLLFGTSVIYTMCHLQKTLHHFDYQLRTCSAQTFDRAVKSYNDMVKSEKRVDVYVNFISTGKLNEKVPLEGLKKSTKFFEKELSKLFPEIRVEFNIYIVDVIKTLSFAIRYIYYVMNMAVVIMNPAGKNMQVGIVLITGNKLLNEIDSKVGFLKEFIKQKLSVNLQRVFISKFTASLNCLSSIRRIVEDFGQKTRILSTSNPSIDYISPHSLQRALINALHWVTGSQNINVITEALSAVHLKISEACGAIETEKSKKTVSGVSKKLFASPSNVTRGSSSSAENPKPWTNATGILPLRPGGMEQPAHTVAGNHVMVVVGSTGTGKSTLCNVVSGRKPHDQELFPVSSSMDSCTNRTTASVVNWAGREDFPLTLIDTPGLLDPTPRKDTINVLEMSHKLKKMAYINVFLIVLNGSCPRFDSSLVSMIKIFQRMFGEDFLKRNSVIEFSNWGYDKQSVRRRGDTKNEMYWTNEINKKLGESVGYEVNAPAVFIDSLYDKSDIEQKNKFLEEMDKLNNYLKSFPPYSCEKLKAVKVKANDAGEILVEKTCAAKAGEGASSGMERKRCAGKENQPGGDQLLKTSTQPVSLNKRFKFVKNNE